MTFWVHEAAPSKENYRKKRMPKGHRDPGWQRILDFQEEVGKACMTSAPHGWLRRIYGEPVSLSIEMFGQRIDLDNCKAIIDALKGIAYPDDAQKYVRCVNLSRGRSGVAGRTPALRITVSRNEEDR
jgi:hypothetical protein